MVAELAERYLHNRVAQIKEIAFELGFPSEAAFAHFFKRATGEWPNATRTDPPRGFRRYRRTAQTGSDLFGFSKR